MQPKTLKLLAVLLITVSFLLAVAGYRLSQGQPVPEVAVAPAPVNENQVLVVKKDLDAGVTISEKDVDAIAFPMKLDTGYQKVEEVVGKVLSRPVPQGAVLRKPDFETGSILSPQIANGYRALAVTVDEAGGTGGFLLPGDRVDVVYSVRANKETASQTLAKVIVKRARVLAYGNVIEGEDPTGNASGKRSRTAVLEVRENEVGSLLLAETTGTLRLAAIGKTEILESSDDEQAKKPNIITLSQLSGRPKPARRRASGIEMYFGEELKTVSVGP